MAQRISWTCPKHPDRLAMLDVCCGCMEEKYGPLIVDDDIEVLFHPEDGSEPITMIC